MTILCAGIRVFINFCEAQVETIAIASNAPILADMSTSVRHGLAVVFAALLGSTASADEVTEEAPVFLTDPAPIESFLWTNRPVIVFADSPADPRFIEQISLLEEQIDALRERDVVVLTDTDPAAKSDLRTELRPRGFMMVLIGKDGGVKLRKPFPWDVRELGRVIDKMPMRQQEIRDRRGDE